MIYLTVITKITRKYHYLEPDSGIRAAIGEFFVEVFKDMVYKLGTSKDMSMLASVTVPHAVRCALQGDLAILDREYGAERNIDHSDGGFLLYCTPGTKPVEIKPFFNPDKHVPEWAEPLRDEPAYTMALYLLTNDYAVELFVATQDVENIISNY